ncbi:MAG TPA: hypothetical protein DEA22_10430 [Blastocatellia bacterium]|nr:hypothetical protein [Blastocatellia bacterium]
MESAQVELAPVGGIETLLREQLLDRRERLRGAESRFDYDPDFSRLLHEVDTALARIEKGSYGICDVCHEPIEAERLIADPLIRLCLGDMTQKQLNLLEEDLRLAADIQKGLLPKPEFSSEFWEVDFAYQPAGAVSGDYVDLVKLDGELFFILGDVSGKGLAASILMSNLHAMFRALIPLGLPLSDLMARANHLFCESTLANQYATLICGRINESGEVEFCNAGHLAPVILGAEGFTSLESAGLPLGMFCDSNFVSSGVKLTSGETLLLFTDGATEALDDNGDEFGIQRLMQTMLQNCGNSPSELLTNCIGAVSAFRNGSSRNDDLSMLALKYRGEPRTE